MPFSSEDTRIPLTKLESKNMKTTVHKIYAKIILLGALLVTVNVAMAQSSSTTTTTTSTGTVNTFSPDTITVTTDASSTPVRYTYSKTTTYVDENGNPVSMETVKSGLPVTVYYDRDGNSLTATKVVVRKSTDVSPDGSVTRQTTTTTSSQGTVSSLSPDSIVIKSDTSPAPVSYTFSKTTAYVDENGNPVSIDTVKSGVPVTVYYDHNGNAMVATRGELVNTDPNAMVIQHKKTTTTTTETTPNP